MIYRFAECELDERLYQLRREGSPVALEPKAFDVLAYLVQHRDRVVSKDELLDKLWPEQVVGENALTRCIRAARSAVGDDGVKQDIIATQHGRGYRFVAPLTTTPPFSLESSVQSLESPLPSTPPDDVQTLDLRLSDSRQSDPRHQTLDDSASPRFWSRNSLLVTSLVLLVGIIIIVQYLSLPLPSTQLLAPSPQTALPLPDKPSIMVLPFTNLSGDPTQEYFGDGITEGVTSNLSGIASLFVIARTSAFTYKGKAARVQEVSREMGVRYILEGSVRKSDNRVRITVQLIDATTGGHLWSERYDRPLRHLCRAMSKELSAISCQLSAKT